MYDQTKKSSAVHNICKFMSLKNDSVVRTMSMLEYDFCFHAEYNPPIVRYESQPHGFEYYFNGRYCRYTPDFQLFDSIDTPSLIEVKHSSQILKPDFRARFREKQLVAKAEYGKKLILVTEKQIRTGFLLSNLKLLHGYSGIRTITDIQKHVLQFVQANRSVTLHHLSHQLKISPDETLTAALCWLSSGEIQTDFNQKKFDLENSVWC
ncbi:endonuclease [Vibrio lentus]|uniref:endonuclease n=1 Tax=Vibrio lentus TaxID=136468 RepID=UPI000C821847|nr:endonuclease [Vibrio lentus]MCC4815421.1 endonuclease [Vibrio lentus]PMG72711.1 endonuclease [Vibrio lentus]PMJ83770.1 endonuclease [Vibrio lentus]PMK91624.1 endonuclease [Vibrio lentus]PML22646.1 endonuclease [Vibrio lentus]